MLADFYHPRRWKRCIQNFHVIWSPALMCSWAMIHGGTCWPGSAVLLRVSQVGGKTTSQLLSWVFIKARIEFLASFPQLLGFYSAKTNVVVTYSTSWIDYISDAESPSCLVCSCIKAALMSPLRQHTKCWCHMSEIALHTQAFPAFF